MNNYRTVPFQDDIEMQNMSGSQRGTLVDGQRIRLIENRDSSAYGTSIKLCEAILVNNTDQVQLLLNDCGAGKTHEDCYNEGVLERGTSLIHIAARKKDSKSLELLLKHESFKEFLDAGDIWGYTPLMYAADAGSLENVKLLVVEGADVSAKSKQGPGKEKQSFHYKPDCSLQKPLQRNVFQIAAGRGNTQILQHLLESSEPDLEFVDDNGWSPLFWAAQSRNSDCFNLVINSGSSIKETDNLGRNIFHILAENDCYDILKSLCDRHLQQEDTGSEYLRLFKAADYNRSTPYMICASKGHLKTFEIFHTYEKELFGIDQNGNTIFHIAAEKGRFQILQLLLNEQLTTLETLAENDSVFFSNPEKCKTYAKDIALLKEISGRAQSIPSSKAPSFKETFLYSEIIKMKNYDECNCFHLAAGSGDIKCLKILYVSCITMCKNFHAFPLKHLDKRNKYGNTPLHYAIRSRCPETIKFLINHGADLMARTDLLPLLCNVTVSHKTDNCDETDGNIAKKGVHSNVDELKRRTNNFIFSKPTSISYIMKLPNGANILRELLNESVYYERNANDRTELIVDFHLLICKSQRRMAITNEIFSQSSKFMPEIFLHPLLKTFIDKEWVDRKYFPWFRFSLYFVYLVILTVYVWLPSHRKKLSKVFAVLVTILSSLLIFVCIPCILCAQNMYERLKAMLIRLPPPTLALMAVFHRGGEGNSSAFLSLAVAISWLSLLFYSNTFSSLNHQTAQFQTVLFKMLRNVAVFVIVIFGFAFTFYVLYFQEHDFATVGDAFLYTSVVLLQGGMENSPFFSRNSTGVPVSIRATEGTISFLFTVVAAVALLNMLIGLAISGAEELRKEGRLVFMRHQVKLLLELDEVEEIIKSSKIIRNWWKKCSGGTYAVTDTAIATEDHKMIVNSENTLLENQIELHFIAQSHRTASRSTTHPYFENKY